MDLTIGDVDMTCTFLMNLQGEFVDKEHRNSGSDLILLAINRYTALKIEDEVYSGKETQQAVVWQLDAASYVDCS